MSVADKKPRVKETRSDRYVPANIDRNRAHLFLANNFPQAVGYQEEERLARLLAHVWNEGWNART